MRGVLANAGGEFRFILGDREGLFQARCPVTCNEVLGETASELLVLVLADLAYFDQGAPAKTQGPEKSMRECLQRFPLDRLRLTFQKRESARHRPFTWCCCYVIDERVGIIDSHGSRKEHEYDTIDSRSALSTLVHGACVLQIDWAPDMLWLQSFEFVTVQYTRHMKRAPQLPILYELIELETVTSVSDEAKRLAREGAEEGTLIWAHELLEGRGRKNTKWISPKGNLHCALILRPESPPAVAVQAHFVSVVSLGVALAGFLSPMSELRYRWPNDVLLNAAKVGAVVSHAPPARRGALEWLVLSIGVNVESHPKNMEFPATSMLAEGCSDLAEVDVLEAFCRQFLSWINCWADRGFAPVRKNWTTRADGIGEAIELRLENEVVSGTFEALDEEGNLILELANGAHRTVSITNAFSA